MAQTARKPIARASLLGVVAGPIAVAVLWVSVRLIGFWETVGVAIMLGGGLIAATRSQIRLRSLFAATFWIALCIACYTIIQREHQAYYRAVDRSIATIPPPQPWSFWIPENVLTVVMMVTPFIATASFFGRALWGFVIGMSVVAAFWFIWPLS